jgi:hypothetical protein
MLSGASKEEFMSAEKTGKVDAAERALAERAHKGGDIESGVARTHAVKARKRRKAAPPPRNSVVTRSAAYLEP